MKINVKQQQRIDGWSQRLSLVHSLCNSHVHIFREIDEPRFGIIKCDELFLKLYS